MMKAIVVRPGVSVPASAIEFRAVRSSGPGGQNVNKVASKVELRVAIHDIAGLDERARRRLFDICGGDVMVVTSQRTRDQPRNLADARNKIAALVSRALVKPKKRKATTPTRAAIDRRIRAKKHRSKTKAQRRVSDD